MPAVSGRSNLPSLHVDVVDHLADGARAAASATPKRWAQHLEGAAIALVGVLGLEHVEAQLARPGHVALRRDELELGLAVDEAPDQPGAGDAVDVDALAGDPDGAAGRGGRRRRHGAHPRRAGAAAARRASSKEAVASRPGAPKKSSAAISVQPPAQAGQRRLAAARFVVVDLPRLAQRLDGVPGLARRVAGSPCRARRETAPRRLRSTCRRRSSTRRASTHRPRRQSPSASQAKLSCAPLGVGQHVDRVLHRDRPNLLQLARGLHPQVGGGGRQLVDEEQPARRAVGPRRRGSGLGRRHEQTYHRGRTDDTNVSGRDGGPLTLALSPADRGEGTGGRIVRVGWRSVGPRSARH